MAISFPSNPAVGQINLTGGKAWRWTGQRWLVTSVITVPVDESVVGTTVVGTVGNVQQAAITLIASLSSNVTGNLTSNTSSLLYPTQANNAGKFLTTDGNVASWGTVSSSMGKSIASSIVFGG